MEVMAAVGALLLSSCVPWVVRSIGDQQNGGEPSRARFDAAAYVDSIWDAKVLPAVSGAVDIRGALLSPSPVLVKGEGKVVRVDRTSRIGLVFVDLPPYDGRADFALQIGPVLRGMALRDALPFIRFSDFVNQLEFARVGNQLNTRIEHDVLGSRSWAGAAGSVVSFAGALDPAAAQVVPLRIALVRRAP